MEKLPRLPLEVLMLIMHEVDSKPTMLACCRLCHTLKDEAEKVLYCNITLFLASQVRRLLQALNRIPRRASFVRYLSVQDRDCGHTGIVSAISTVNEIIPRFSKLEHLVLEAAAWTRNPGLFDSVLSTLNTCDFALVSFEPRCIKFAQRELLTFLSRQPTITFLNLHFLGYNPARVAFPHGALPRLKYLDTTVDCFMTTLRAPRSITHLSLNRLNILMKDLKRVLRIVGHQLVSLKYDPPAKSPPLGPVAPPIFPFKIADMPRLRFLDVIEIMHDNVRISKIEARRRERVLTSASYSSIRASLPMTTMYSRPSHDRTSCCIHSSGV